MGTTYLLVGGTGAFIAVVVVVAIFLKTRRPDIANKKISFRGGLAVSEEVFKNEKMSSDFILGSIEDGVAMVGRDNIIHLFNPAASKITGWPPEEAIGLDYRNVLALVNERGEVYEPNAHPIAQALAQQKAIRDSKSWLVTKGKKSLPISLIVSTLPGQDGQPGESVVGVFRDISREKAEEAQRVEFISTASHEMRTPLAAIEGYLALALNEKISKLDDNARKYINKAESATTHLSELFQDLLTSSKAEDGRLSSYPTVVELGEITEQVVEAGRFKAKEKNLLLNYVVSSDQDVSQGKVLRPFYYTFVDPNRIREVVQNLIDNAVKYTMQGSITVRLTGNTSVVQIQIQDSGQGIPPEDIPHLFQKFYRVDSSLTRTVGGTGLGLFISKKIVELYNGRVWVESQLGKGSTFFISLPRLTAEQALQAQKQQASLVSPLEVR